MNTSSTPAAATRNILGLNVVDSRLIPEKLFSLNMQDLTDKTIQDEIVKFVREYTDIDFVYKLELASFRVNRLLTDFHQEQVDKGTYHIDGKIGKEYQSFVDYWVYVCSRLGSKSGTYEGITPKGITTMFVKEQQDKGVYNLDGPIGKEYKPFVEYWVNVVCSRLGQRVKESHVIDDYGSHGQGLRCLGYLPEDTGKGVYIAGSTALNKLNCILSQNKNSWKSNDTDLFYVGCPTSTRIELRNTKLDMVFCKEKTIEDVLLNFDLPCCRVGFDFKYNFYVSIQALCAIFTGKMYLPKYMEKADTFKSKLKEYKKDDLPWVDSVSDLIVHRFHMRVKKYQSRGFATKYTKHNYVLPWMKNRFTYIDFENQINPVVPENNIVKTEQEPRFKPPVNITKTKIIFSDGKSVECNVSQQIGVVLNNNIKMIDASNVKVGDVLMMGMFSTGEVKKIFLS